MTLKRNNGGYTLAETIVCFALLGIFVVAAAVLIESSTEVYYNTKSDSGGHETVQTLLKDVRGELEDALPSVMYSVAMSDGEMLPGPSHPEKSEPVYLAVREDGRAVEYTDSDGHHAALIFSDGKLEKYYYPVYGPVKDAGGNVTEYVKISDGCSVTKYSGDIGMGYSIEKLEFSLVIPTAGQSEGPQCPAIRVEVTLKSDSTAAYGSSELIGLYGFYEKGKWQSVQYTDEIS